MPDIVAKTMAALTAILLVAALAVLYLTSHPSAGAQQVVAQFQNAFPLLEGMSVRVDGAIAGSIGKISVDDDGLADVTLVLDDRIEPARADATAAIRQQDTTGDSYVAFEPGTAKAPLAKVDGEPTIACDIHDTANPCKNTLVTPRFDDLINAFGPPERAGVKLILSELSTAVDRRGDDLNRAALKLVPALDAANRALAEVNTQNTALRRLIVDAENVTGQAATKRQELGRLIDSLDRILTTTAEERAPLDEGIAKLPQTASRTRSTLSALTRAAVAGRPLAQILRDGAPRLASAIHQAPGFLDDLGAVIDDTTPTLNLTRRLLKAGAPTIEADPTRVVTGTFDLAPALSNLLTGILGDDNTIRALWGDDSDGVLGAGTLDGYGLGAIAVEPGNQPLYPPDYDPNRRFLRISAVINCEVFGVPVAPGCLLGALKAARKADAAKAGGGATGEGEATSAGVRVATVTPASHGGAGAGPPPGDAKGPLNARGLGIGDTIRRLGDGVRGLGGKLGLGGASKRPPKLGNQALTNILDFVLG